LAQVLPIQQISLPTPWATPGDVHVYLVREDPVTLIDAGLHMPASREALLEGLRRAGVSVRDIRRVLLTHAHLDHHGQAAWIQAEAGAEVWIHPGELGKAQAPDWWIAQRDRILDESGVPAEARVHMNQLWQVSRQLTLPLSDVRLLADGQRFAFASGELTAIHLPGHALGHTGYWDAAGGTLVGGDHLLDGVTPNPIMEPLPPGDTGRAAAHAPDRALTLGQFLQSLERVIGMPVAQVLPGHGPIIHQHVPLARSYMARHERRLESLHRRLDGGMTAYDITRRVYPKVGGFDVFLALSEVLAHLDLLVDRGLAAVGDGGAGQLYRTV